MTLISAAELAAASIDDLRKTKATLEDLLRSRTEERLCDAVKSWIQRQAWHEPDDSASFAASVSSGIVHVSVEGKSPNGVEWCIATEKRDDLKEALGLVLSEALEVAERYVPNVYIAFDDLFPE